MGKSEAGKGDDPRPFSVPLDKYYKNYDRIFGKSSGSKENKNN